LEIFPWILGITFQKFSGLPVGYMVHRIHVRNIYDKLAVVIHDIREKLEIGGEGDT